MPTVNVEFLKRALSAHGTKTAVAAEAGISRNTLDAALAGRNVKRSKLEAIAAALNVTYDDLVAPKPISGPKGPSNQQLQRVWWTSSVTARINLHMVAHRYGVQPAAILESAPILFAIAAEQSLSDRRRHLAEVDSRLDSVYFDGLCARVPTLQNGVVRAQEALAVEERSINARDIDGRIEDRDQPGDGHSPFVAHLTKALSELGLANFESDDWQTTEAFARHAAIFEDEVLAIHGGDERACFAVRERPVILGMIPKEFAVAEGETTERAQRRYQWLASQVPDDVWEAHLEEMRNISEELGDV